MTSWRREGGGGLVWSGKGPGDAVTKLLRGQVGVGPPVDMRWEEQTVCPLCPPEGGGELGQVADSSKGEGPGQLSPVAEPRSRGLFKPDSGAEEGSLEAVIWSQGRTLTSKKINGSHFRGLQRRSCPRGRLKFQLRREVEGGSEEASGCEEICLLLEGAGVT